MTTTAPEENSKRKDILRILALIPQTPKMIVNSPKVRPIAEFMHGVPLGTQLQKPNPLRRELMWNVNAIGLTAVLGLVLAATNFHNGQTLLGVAVTLLAVAGVAYFGIRAYAAHEAVTAFEADRLIARANVDRVHAAIHQDSEFTVTKNGTLKLLRGWDFIAAERLPDYKGRSVNVVLGRNTAGEKVLVGLNAANGALHLERRDA